MIKNKSISISVTTFLIVGFFFLALPDEGRSGVPFSLGCCVSSTPSECLGCPDTASNCSIPQAQCLNMPGEQFFAGGQVCIDSPEGGLCVTPEDTGCCVIAPGNCTDDTAVSACGVETCGLSLLPVKGLLSVLLSTSLSQPYPNGV